MKTKNMISPKRAIYGTWYNNSAYQTIYGQGCIHFRDVPRDNSRNICIAGVMSREEVKAYAGQSPVFDISACPLSLVGSKN
jgi:hypothetical protein